jgi:hypothetical protein
MPTYDSNRHLLQKQLAGPHSGSNTTFWAKMKNFSESHVFDSGFEAVLWQPTRTGQRGDPEELVDMGFVRRTKRAIILQYAICCDPERTCFAHMNSDHGYRSRI